MAMPAAAAAGDMRYRCPGLPGTRGIPGGRTPSCGSLRRCAKMPPCGCARGLFARFGVEARLPPPPPPPTPRPRKRSCEGSRAKPPPRHPGEGARLPLPPAAYRYDGEDSRIRPGVRARPPARGKGVGDISRPRIGVDPRAEPPTCAPMDGLLCLSGVATPAAAAAAAALYGDDLLGRTS
jgi:hypothetical protein